MVRARVRRFAVVTFVAALALTACTSNADDQPAPGQDGVTSSGPTATSSTPSPTPTPVAPQAELRTPEDDVTVLPGKDPAKLALAASASLFTSAPVVVLAAADDDAEVLRAAGTAVALGAPLLLTGHSAAAPDETVLEELERLDTEAVLTFGIVSDATDATDATDGADSTDDAPAWVAAPKHDAELAELLGLDAEDAVAVGAGKEIKGLVALSRGSLTPLVRDEPEDGAGSGDGTESDNGAEAGDDAEPEESATPEPAATLPEIELAEPLADVLTLTTNSATGLAAVATAQAAGAQMEVIPGGDPRRSSESLAAISDADYAQVVGIGAAFKNADTLTWRLETAATGVELPGGGQLVFPGKRYVALYGTPSTTALGVLGEQDVPATIKRAAKHAKKYEKHSDDAVVPALEIIATVASAGAGSDGNYSNELSPESLRPLVDAAYDAGQYVLLDLQPGRSSFLEQAKLYQELLALPNVGLALDPEWNLGPDEVHLKKIGSVSATEVNDVVTWLADFTQQRALPQKMLVLHQFQPRMIDTVDKVDQSRSEIALLIHVDGQGGQPAKQGTWKTLHAHAPDMQWWGWKNFYDEDEPMLTPKQTSQVKPFPNFISYQ